MSQRSKALVVLGVIALVAFMVFLVLRSVSKLRTGPETISPPATSWSGGNIYQRPPNNVFLPVPVPPSQPVIDFITPPPTPTSAPQQAVVPKIPKIQAPSLSLNDLQNKLNELVAPTSTANQMLPLPKVLDGELSINTSGISSTVDFLSYLILNGKDAKFDFSRLAAIVNSDQTAPLSLTGLINQALDSGNYVSIQSRLGILRDMAIAKVDFEKSLGVTGDAIDTNRTTIALDELTIQLIDKFNDLASGKINRDDFSVFYKGYKNTVNFYTSGFFGKTGLLSIQTINDHDLFSWALRITGLATFAEAVPPLIGGLVSIYAPCTCTYLLGSIYAAFVVATGPPKSLGTFALSPFSILYEYFSPYPGHWVLGIYSPAPIPCLYQAAFECLPMPVPQPTLGPVIIMGTSSI